MFNFKLRQLEVAALEPLCHIDVFWGGEGFVLQPFHSYKNLSRCKESELRRVSGILQMCLLMSGTLRSNKDLNLINSTLRLWISVLL